MQNGGRVELFSVSMKDRSTKCSAYKSSFVPSLCGICSCVRQLSIKEERGQLTSNKNVKHADRLELKMAFLSQQFRSDAQPTVFKIIATNAENNTLLPWKNLRSDRTIDS